MKVDDVAELGLGMCMVGMGVSVIAAASALAYYLFMSAGCR